MFRHKKAWSLRSSILLSCIGCTVLAMLLQLVLFNAISSSIIAGQTAQINRTTLQNLSDDVYNRFKRIENSLITIYEHKSFVRELADAGSTDELARKYAALAYEMAGSAFESDEHLVALYIYSMDHALISSYRHAQYGYGSALTITVVFALLVVAFLQVKVLKKREVQM